MILQVQGSIIYLWGRSGQLEGVLDVVQPDVIGISQVEQLSNPGLDFYLVERLFPDPCWVCASLVLEARMYPLLARLDPSADEVPDHAWTIQFSPRDHPEQLCDLLQVLGLF